MAVWHEGDRLAQVTKESAYLSTDPKQRYWLNLLGYDVDTSVTPVDSKLGSDLPYGNGKFTPSRCDHALNAYFTDPVRNNCQRFNDHKP